MKFDLLTPTQLIREIVNTVQLEIKANDVLLNLRSKIKAILWLVSKVMKLKILSIEECQM
jgi:tRNA threonylcarbamoyladenosine modification (KEOPS) complex  Pcc1 subunit